MKRIPSARSGIALWTLPATAGRKWPRRSIMLSTLTAAAWLPGLTALAADKKAAGSDDASPDVALYCDPTLGPAMRQAGALFRAHAQAAVAVLSAPPPLMLAQIERQARNDVLLTLSDNLDDAVRRDLVRPETRIDGWRNRLVLAGRAGEVSPFLDISPDALRRLLGDSSLAVTDPTVSAAFDGAAILDQFGITPSSVGKVMGAADTADVAFLVKTGVARLGLLYLTDVRSDPALAVASTLHASEAPIRYAAAVSRKAKSPNAQAFLEFLRTPEIVQRLQAMGLETLV